MLITDIVMPGESGPELAATVSAMQPAIATIFISGYAEHAALEDALRQPHVVFMQKPFRFGELVKTIRQVLDERNAKSVAS
jgi:DNA-binding NtrC family response regulator